MPQLDRRVIDRANVLQAATEQRLEQILAAFERDTSHQIVVHTTPSLEGLPIEDYSIQIAEAWKVGHKGLDNGAILTVAPSERKVRIEVGYGLEGVIPDAIATRIIREAILPAFRSQDIERGILEGVALLQSAASGEVIPASDRPSRPQRGRRRGGGGYPIWVWLLVFAMFGFRGIFFLPFLGGLGGRRGSGGFGGGFSGGGGGFGGGGASGSW